MTQEEIDALIQFAAKVLDVKIKPIEVESTGERIWMHVDDTGGITDDFDILNSWEWMGRGLEVCPYMMRLVKESFVEDGECFVVQVGSLIEKCSSIDVPLMFWSCWMQLEEG